MNSVRDKSTNIFGEIPGILCFLQTHKYFGFQELGLPSGCWEAMGNGPSVERLTLLRQSMETPEMGKILFFRQQVKIAVDCHS